MKITAIIEPSSASAESSTVASPRAFDAADEFAAALGRHTGVHIEIAEGSLDDAPPDGYVVVFTSAGLDKRPDIRRRVVLINADRSTVLRQLEEYELVAAVEKHRYSLWKTGRESDTNGAFFGRKDLLLSIGATLLGGPFQSARYALCAAKGPNDLPSLLGAYLAAYSQASSGHRAQ